MKLETDYLINGKTLVFNVLPEWDEKTFLGKIIYVVKTNRLYFGMKKGWFGVGRGSTGTVGKTGSTGAVGNTGRPGKTGIIGSTGNTGGADIPCCDFYHETLNKVVHYLHIDDFIIDHKLGTDQVFLQFYDQWDRELLEEYSQVYKIDNNNILITSLDLYSSGYKYLVRRVNCLFPNVLKIYSLDISNEWNIPLSEDLLEFNSFDFEFYDIFGTKFSPLSEKIIGATYKVEFEETIAGYALLFNYKKIIEEIEITPELIETQISELETIVGNKINPSSLERRFNIHYQDEPSATWDVYHMLNISDMSKIEVYLWIPSESSCTKDPISFRLSETGKSILVPDPEEVGFRRIPPFNNCSDLRILDMQPEDVPEAFAERGLSSIYTDGFDDPPVSFKDALFVDWGPTVGVCTEQPELSGEEDDVNDETNEDNETNKCKEDSSEEPELPPIDLCTIPICREVWIHYYQHLLDPVTKKQIHVPLKMLKYPDLLYEMDHIPQEYVDFNSLSTTECFSNCFDIRTQYIQFSSQKDCKNKLGYDYNKVGSIDHPSNWGYEIEVINHNVVKINIKCCLRHTIPTKYATSGIAILKLKENINREITHPVTSGFEYGKVYHEQTFPEGQLVSVASVYHGLRSKNLRISVQGLDGKRLNSPYIIDYPNENAITISFYKYHQDFDGYYFRDLFNLIGRGVLSRGIAHDSPTVDENHIFKRLDIKEVDISDLSCCVQCDRTLSSYDNPDWDAFNNPGVCLPEYIPHEYDKKCYDDYGDLGQIKPIQWVPKYALDYSWRCNSAEIDPGNKFYIGVDHWFTDRSVHFTHQPPTISPLTRHQDGLPFGSKNISITKEDNFIVKIYRENPWPYLPIYLAQEHTETLLFTYYHITNYNTNEDYIWKINHNLNIEEKDLYFKCYDENNNRVIPSSLVVKDSNSFSLIFSNKNRYNETFLIFIPGRCEIYSVSEEQEISLELKSEHEHIQQIPNIVWTIRHDLESFNISIKVKDLLNKPLQSSSILYINPNECLILFDEPQSGVVTFVKTTNPIVLPEIEEVVPNVLPTITFGNTTFREADTKVHTPINFSGVSGVDVIELRINVEYDPNVLTSPDVTLNPILNAKLFVNSFSGEEGRVDIIIVSESTIPAADIAVISFNINNHITSYLTITPYAITSNKKIITLKNKSNSIILNNNIINKTLPYNKDNIILNPNLSLRYLKSNFSSNYNSSTIFINLILSNSIYYPITSLSFTLSFNSSSLVFKNCFLNIKKYKNIQLKIKLLSENTLDILLIPDPNFSYYNNLKNGELLMFSFDILESNQLTSLDLNITSISVYNPLVYTIDLEDYSYSIPVVPENPPSLVYTPEVMTTIPRLSKMEIPDLPTSKHDLSMPIKECINYCNTTAMPTKCHCPRVFVHEQKEFNYKWIVNHNLDSINIPLTVRIESKSGELEENSYGYKITYLDSNNIEIVFYELRPKFVPPPDANISVWKIDDWYPTTVINGTEFTEVVVDPNHDYSSFKPDATFDPSDETHYTHYQYEFTHRWFIHHNLNSYGLVIDVYNEFNKLIDVNRVTYFNENSICLEFFTDEGDPLIFKGVAAIQKRNIVTRGFNPVNEFVQVVIPEQKRARVPIFVKGRAFLVIPYETAVRPHVLKQFALEQHEQTSTWRINHNLDSTSLSFRTWDKDGNPIYPTNIEYPNNNTANLHIGKKILGEVLPHSTPGYFIIQKISPFYRTREKNFFVFRYHRGMTWTQYYERWYPGESLSSNYLTGNDEYNNYYWEVRHNLGMLNPIIICYDEEDNIIHPFRIFYINEDYLEIIFVDETGNLVETNGRAECYKYDPINWNYYLTQCSIKAGTGGTGSTGLNNMLTGGTGSTGGTGGTGLVGSINEEEYVILTGGTGGSGGTGDIGEAFHTFDQTLGPNQCRELVGHSKLIMEVPGNQTIYRTLYMKNIYNGVLFYTFNLKDLAKKTEPIIQFVPYNLIDTSNADIDPDCLGHTQDHVYAAPYFGTEPFNYFIKHDDVYVRKNVSKWSEDGSEYHITFGGVKVTGAFATLEVYNLAYDDYWSVSNEPWPDSAPYPIPEGYPEGYPTYQIGDYPITGGTGETGYTGEPGWHWNPQVTTGGDGELLARENWVEQTFLDGFAEYDISELERIFNTPGYQSYYSKMKYSEDWKYIHRHYMYEYMPPADQYVVPIAGEVERTSPVTFIFVLDSRMNVGSIKPFRHHGGCHRICYSYYGCFTQCWSDWYTYFYMYDHLDYVLNLILAIISSKEPEDRIGLIIDNTVMFHPSVETGEMYSKVASWRAVIGRNYYQSRFGGIAYNEYIKKPAGIPRGSATNVPLHTKHAMGCHEAYAYSPQDEQLPLMVLSFQMGNGNTPWSDPVWDEETYQWIDPTLDQNEADKAWAIDIAKQRHSWEWYNSTSVTLFTVALDKNYEWRHLQFQNSYVYYSSPTPLGLHKPEFFTEYAEETHGTTYYAQVPTALSGICDDIMYKFRNSEIYTEWIDFTYDLVDHEGKRDLRVYVGRDTRENKTLPEGLPEDLSGHAIVLNDDGWHDHGKVIGPRSGFVKQEWERVSSHQKWEIINHLSVKSYIEGENTLVLKFYDKYTGNPVDVLAQILRTPESIHVDIVYNYITRNVPLCHPLTIQNCKTQYRCEKVKGLFIDNKCYKSEKAYCESQGKYWYEQNCYDTEAEYLAAQGKEWFYGQIISGPLDLYYWEVGEWSDCTKDCEGGLQTRSVKCMRIDGLVMDDSYLLDLVEKPEVVRICNTHDCPECKCDEFHNAETEELELYLWNMVYYHGHWQGDWYYFTRSYVSRENCPGIKTYYAYEVCREKPEL